MSDITVFVSSKMVELRPERECLHELLPSLDLGAVRMRPWIFESPQGAPASNASIRTVYLNALQRSALYVGILGNEYGEWTIDEFNQATRWGVDRHLYVKGTPDQDRNPRLKAFLHRWNDVETGVTLKFFRSLDELKEVVRHSTAIWAAEQVHSRLPSVSARVLAANDQIPERAQKLLGRDRIVEELLGALGSGHRALVCGFAGSGKSAVAAAACETWIDRTGGKALWLRCGFARLEDIVAAVARALRRPPSPLQLPRDEQLHLLQELLAEASGPLVVLDDCWNGEALFSVLAAIPRGTPVLITARQRYPIDHICEVAELAHADALELLASNAGRTLAADPQAQALCEALSRHAFSIEIAGRTLRTATGRTCSDLLREIGSSRHELETPLGFGERSRRSVKALLGVSMDALSADQQLAFLAFGAFFAPTLKSEMVDQFLHTVVVWSDEQLELPMLSHGPGGAAITAKLLQALEEHCLVRRTFVGESPLTHVSMRRAAGGVGLEVVSARPPPLEVYQVHDLAYSYARSRATEAQRRRALDITVASACFYNATAPEVFDVLRTELDNFVGAATWAMSAGHTRHAERLAELIARSGTFLPNQGLLQQAELLLRYAKRAAELRGDKRAATQTQFELAAVMYLAGRLDDAKAVYERELALARVSADKTFEQVALSNLGLIHRARGELDLAERFTRDAMAAARELGDQSLEADLIGKLGAITAQRGKLGEAAALLEEAVGRMPEQSSGRALPAAIAELADVQRRARNWAAAASNAERALVIFSKSGDLRGISMVARTLAMCQWALGEIDACIGSMEQARRSFASLGDQEMVAVCEAQSRRWDHALTLFNRGVELSNEGRGSGAEAAYREAMALQCGEAANNLAALLLQQGRNDEARAAFETGVALGCRVAAVNLGLTLDRQGLVDDAERALLAGIALGSGPAATHLGAMKHRQGLLDEAERWFRSGAALGDGQAIFFLGVLAASAGRSDEAKTLYRRALDLGYGEAADNLGGTLYLKGHHQEATEVLRRGIGLGSPGSARILGTVLVHMGRIAEAIEAFRLGIELGDPECAQLIAELEAGDQGSQSADS